MKMFFSRHAGIVTMGIACALGATHASESRLSESVQVDPNQQEQDEARRRVIEKSLGQEKDIMDRIMERMEQASESLHTRFDAGPQTQQLQQKILEELEIAIQQAKQNMQRASASTPQKSDPRQEGKPADSQQDQSPEDSQSGQESGQTGGSPAEPDDPKSGGALEEHRRQWGHLPPRDRQEIMQGYNEEVSEDYREQIERYYQSLADLDEKQ